MVVTLSGMFTAVSPLPLNAYSSMISTPSGILTFHTFFVVIANFPMTLTFWGMVISSIQSFASIRIPFMITKGLSFF